MFYIIYEIRRRHLVQKQTITEIARDMGLSRPTVRKHLNTIAEPKYVRVQPIAPKLGQFEEQLTQWLEEESKLPRSRRRSGQRLFEGLQEAGYIGAHDMALLCIATLWTGQQLAKTPIGVFRREKDA